ncbi:MAG: hypothetical protein IKS99_01300 [Firmicutes bacterium]|nr:hypothetical protein [Bacillota bacterium]
MAIAMGLLLIPLMLLGLLIIPILAALIYKGSYTRHLNEQMETGVVTKRWISPFMVGLIAFLIEMLIIAGMFSLFMLRGKTMYESSNYVEIDSKGCQSWTYSTDEVKGTDYEIFNGDLVENYSMTIEAKGDFYCYAYHRMAGPETMPTYALLVEYRGDKKFGTFTGYTSFGKEPNSVFLGNDAVNSGDNKVVVIIEPDDMILSTSYIDSDGTDTNFIYKDDVELSYTLDIVQKDPDAPEDSEPFKVLDEVTFDLSAMSF